jgi:23S rRNA pseudouridine1911/1915/1917 synthase
MWFFHPRWPVFHEDNHLLVLYKPAGLLMQRGPVDKPDLIDLAKAWLKARHDRPGQVFAGLVHRLDAPVAGVVVAARTSKAAGRLSGQFRDGTVRKTYLAVVHGRPRQTSERLAHFLARDGRYSRVVDPRTAGAQAAALTCHLIEHRAPRSLLRIDLETGRRHQIRSQLAAIGLPIMGDRAYGSPIALKHGRIALLAQRLEFAHPTLRTTMVFECPLPEGWPWPIEAPAGEPPLWTLEEYQENGLMLPKGPV